MRALRAWIVMVTVLMFAVVSSSAQEHKSSGTIDDYCITVNTQMDQQDEGINEVDTLIPKTPASQRPPMIEGQKQLRALVKQVRNDACESKNLSAAHVAVARDRNKLLTLNEKLLQQAKHNLADSYRAKAKQ